MQGSAGAVKENGDCIPVAATDCGRRRLFDAKTMTTHQNGNGSTNGVSSRVLPMRRQHYSVIGAFYRAALQTASVTQTSSSTAQEISTSVFDKEPLHSNFILGNAAEFRPIVRRVRTALVVSFLFPPVCVVVAIAVICTSGFVQPDGLSAAAIADFVTAVNRSTVTDVVWSIFNCCSAEVAANLSATCIDAESRLVNGTVSCRPVTVSPPCLSSSAATASMAFVNVLVNYSVSLPFTYAFHCSSESLRSCVENPSASSCCCSLFVCYPLDPASPLTSGARGFTPSESTTTTLQRLFNVTVFLYDDSSVTSPVGGGDANATVAGPSYQLPFASRVCQASTSQIFLDESSYSSDDGHAVVVFAVLGSLIGLSFALASIWFASVVVVRFHRRRLPSLIDSVKAARVTLDAAVADLRRSDALLCEMLPRWVADRLKAGLTVDPETFDEVTIYFSDIPGFHDVAHTCQSPLDIVTLLNSVFG
jgi:hypothetical protein